MTPDPDDVMPLSAEEVDAVRHWMYVADGCGYPLAGLRDGGSTSLERRLLATLDAARAPHDAPALDRERLVAWAESFLGGLSFNEPTLQAAGWAERRAPDLADSILAALGDVRLPETGLREAVRYGYERGWADGSMGLPERDELAVTLYFENDHGPSRAALSVPATGPEGLDVETLAQALGGYVRHRNDDCGQDTPCEHDRTVARGLAREYDRIRGSR